MTRTYDHTTPIAALCFLPTATVLRCCSSQQSASANFVCVQMVDLEQEVKQNTATLTFLTEEVK